jgi:hypothetical protein
MCASCCIIFGVAVSFETHCSTALSTVNVHAQTLLQVAFTISLVIQFQSSSKCSIVQMNGNVVGKTSISFTAIVVVAVQIEFVSVELALFAVAYTSTIFFCCMI